MYCNVCQVYSLVLALLFVVRLSMSAVVISDAILVLMVKTAVS